MARANLYTSMNNAMDEAFQAVEPAPTVSVQLEPTAQHFEQEQEPPPQPQPEDFVPVSRRRTLRARLFGRIADYARRYFTASVDHRLTLVQDQLNAMSAQGDQIQGQTKRLLGSVEWASAQMVERLAAIEARCGQLELQNSDLRSTLESTMQRLSGSVEAVQSQAAENYRLSDLRADRLEQVAHGHSISIAAVQGEIGDRLDVSEARIDRIEQLARSLTGSMDTVQAQMLERFGAMAGRSESLQLLTQGLFALANTTQAQMLERFSGLDVQTKDLELLARGVIKNTEDSQIIIGRVGAMLSEVGENLRGLPGLLGPRLDEIEIKIRPLVTFDDASYAVRLRDGYAMVPRDEPVFAVMVANATSEGLEPGTRRVLQALIEPGMVVADVGANVGLLTLACAVATGPSGRVISFEPEPGPRSQLEKTRHLNGLSWVDIRDQAVGAKAGPMTFNVSPIIGHSSLYALPKEDGAGREITVQVTRLDDVIAKGGRLDVVKIDVEGAELDVLAGMSRILSENPDIALVAEYGPSHLQRIGVTPKAWFAAFKDAGFDAYSISEPTGICNKVSYRDLKDVVSVNLAFVRPKGAAQGRLPR